MPKREFVFQIKRAAKKSGGDRYECGKDFEEDHMVIYVPQSISREGGKLRQDVKLIVE